MKQPWSWEVHLLCFSEVKLQFHLNISLRDVLLIRTSFSVFLSETCLSISYARRLGSLSGVRMPNVPGNVSVL